MKILKWVGSSYDDLMDFPEDIRHLAGYALHLAQTGERHIRTRVFRGMGNAQVLEIREFHESGTYRIVYTTEIKKFIFVLHAFQKKSKKGIETSKQDVDLIHSRLREAKEYHKELEEVVKNETKNKR